MLSIGIDATILRKGWVSLQEPDGRAWF